MSLKIKAVATCDGKGCDARAEGDPSVKDIGFTERATRGTTFEGWHDVGGGRHLCPACWLRYEELMVENRQNVEELFD